MKPTIYDIANKSGVSKSTVSRVLNNQENISPEAKEKVLAAIKELNYMPSKLARGLTGNGFDAILTLSHRSVSSTSGNPFFSDVIQSISAVTEKHDFDLILQTSKNNQEEAQKIKNKLNEKLIRGIIILSASQDEQYLEELDALQIPIVIIGKLEKEYEYIYSVDTDNYSDSYKMIQTLIDLGHKEIACLHAPLDIHVSADRVNGYRKALFDNYLDIKNEWIIDGGYVLEESIQAAKKLFSDKQLPTAIFATDALKALSLFQVIEKEGYKIPDNFSLIAFNDESYSAFFTPRLSGINVPTNILGTKATELLFKLIDGEKDLPKKIIIPTELNLTNSVSKK
ncbi:LacI family DNA-binding transcriptional regulator [Candidatus Enterococcus murrayae]|uniref:LacI family DNA-binding transcriptional regulator n=1 Tax=Candidatus Enterococcus murrayae TaxID=2815321 RepID=A0ABS3HIB6_9ENTE|nr:LacI family DNA-binding transcriptional regulator [Enterococcus sp. MJM16]MBO0453208.1 LacI family DNA-binding transcriptional regulator [Enterococcus sp. MJM16]